MQNYQQMIWLQFDYSVLHGNLFIVISN